MGHAKAMRRVQDAAVSGKAVLVRVDYNVPMAGTTIKDDGRIRASLPTIDLLLARGATVVLATHLGRPDGVAVAELRLDPIARRLAELLGRPVRKLDDCIGADVVREVRGSAAGTVLLLENVRFHREEEENDSGFSGALAEIADVYVDDAFGTAHRAHATTVGVAERLPSYAGLLLQREVDVLSRLVASPDRPYWAIVGGKKASDKLGVLRDLVSRVDGILIGGGVAFTFLAATGADVGDSRVDGDLLEDIRGIAQQAEEKGTKIVLPVDAVLAPSLREPEKAAVGSATRIPHGLAGFDIGPQTVVAFARHIAAARSIVWAGPMGAFETPAFAAGTRGVAEAVARSGAFSVIGGGETGEAIEEMGLSGRVSFISTGGGACLSFVRGKTLPALAVLEE
jgi:phosphoglycerate kinase